MNDNKIGKLVQRTNTERKGSVAPSREALSQIKRQERIRHFRGKLVWEGDLDRSRTSRIARRSVL